MSQPSTHPLLRKWQIELNGLPDGSVVLDRYNHAWQNSRGYWYRSYGDDSEVSSWDLHFKGPGKTIWRPDE